MTSCGKRLSFLAVFSLILCIMFVSMVGCGPEHIKKGKIITKIKKVFKGEEIDSPYFFSSIIKICKNKDYVYVADWKLLSVSILDRNLNFIKRIGKKGAGPGEFKILVSDIFCDESNLYVKTIRDLHIFSTEGEFVKQVTLKFMPNKSYKLKDGFLFKIDNSPELFFRTDMQFNVLEKFYENDYLSTPDLGKIFVGSNAYMVSNEELLIMKSTDYHLERLDLKTKKKIWEFKRDVDFWSVSVQKTGKGNNYMIYGGFGEIFEDNDTYKYIYQNSKKEQMMDVYRKTDLNLIGSYEYEGKVRPMCYRPEYKDYLGTITGDNESLYLFELVESPSS